MALYLPRLHLALEIVDDPNSAPVERDAFPDIEVIPVTCAQIGDPNAMDSLMDDLLRGRAAGHARTHAGRAGRRTGREARGADEVTLVARRSPTDGETA